MHAEFRSSSYRNNNDTFQPHENGEKKSVEASTEKNSLIKWTEENFFSDQKIEQVQPSRWNRIWNAAYRDGNRGAVTLGLAGGIVGGAFSGPSGAMFGMSVGSGLGSHLGALGGSIQEYSALPPGETEPIPFRSRFHRASSDLFLGHVIQVVDHAGHHAAIGSIGAGVLTLAASLASANPLLVAFHIAGVYSGAAWSLGLTTGSAHWLLRHIHRAGDQQLFPEQKQSDLEEEQSEIELVERKERSDVGDDDSKKIHLDSVQKKIE